MRYRYLCYVLAALWVLSNTVTIAQDIKKMQPENKHLENAQCDPSIDPNCLPSTPEPPSSGCTDCQEMPEDFNLNPQIGW